MDVNAAVTAQVTPEAMFEVVNDLGRYPEWLDIVARAEPVDGVESDPGPAWLIDLRGQLGPLRRSKRLRMTRTVSDEPNRVRFERREVDGRSHSDWVLEAVVVRSVGASGEESDSEESVTLEMSLHYGGTMWVPLLDRLLSDEIRRSRGRLLELLASER